MEIKKLQKNLSSINSLFVLKCCSVYIKKEYNTHRNKTEKNKISKLIN